MDLELIDVGPVGSETVAEIFRDPEKSEMPVGSRGHDDIMTFDEIATKETTSGVSPTRHKTTLSCQTVKPI